MQQDPERVQGSRTPNVTGALYPSKPGNLDLGVFFFFLISFFPYLNASIRFNLNMTIIKSAHSCVLPPPQRPLKQLDFCIFLSGTGSRVYRTP